MLKSLIYKSNHTNIDQNTIAAILETARKNNKEHNVTGALCVGSDYFVQCLEGEAENVDLIYNKIKADDRHINLFVITEGPAQDRKFQAWNMAYITSKDLSQDQENTLSNSSEVNIDEIYNILVNLVSRKEDLFSE